MKIVVGVPTYKRPHELEALLPLLLAQADELVDREVAILVVDNDPAATARRVAQGGGDRVHYAVEPTPGIAAVRNRILDVATDDLRADLVVMIDDDERPEAGWLTALVDTQVRTGAVLVAGVVVPQFEAELDPWIAAGRFHTRFHTQKKLSTGSAIDVAAAGNLLLDARQLRMIGQRFDERVGLAGGEDTLFSRELHSRGGSMVWCAEAVAIDRVPLDRMTRRWVLARAMSHGDATIRVGLQLRPPSKRPTYRVRSVLGGVARVVGGGARAATGELLRRPVDSARGVRTAMRGVGMVRGALGLHHVEYAREEPRAAA